MSPVDEVSPGRPRRADARRNYDALLAAAKEVFTEQGEDAPFDDVAKRARLGNATLYRHFPTRRDLLVAVYADEVAALCEHGRTLRADRSPGDALFAWLVAFVAHVGSKRQLSLTVPDNDRSELFARWQESMHDTAAALLEAAQHAGAVRPELDAMDVLLLANGIALAGADAEQGWRLLGLIRTNEPEPRS
jgi:AcrR family transcriptional regulator